MTMIVGFLDFFQNRIFFQMVTKVTFCTYITHNSPSTFHFIWNLFTESILKIPYAHFL